MFSRSELDELLEVEAEPAVLLYLPTHPAGREVRQNPIRLKNLLSSTAERLAASRRKPEIDALLAPAEAVVGNDGFWRQQSKDWPSFSPLRFIAPTNCRSRHQRKHTLLLIFTSSRCFRFSKTPDHSGC